MSFRLKGIYVSMITPFKPNGELDKDGLRSTINYLIENEVDGLLCLGGTGEAVCLSDEERKDVVDIVIDQVNGKVPVVIGAIGINTSYVIKLTRKAEDTGADAVMIVPPYFVYSTYQNIFEHYRTIAEAVDLPIVLFHTPKRSGVRLNSEIILKLLEIDNIVGIKDSSGDLLLLQEVIRRTKRTVSVLSGLDALVFAILAIGGEGAMITSAGLIPNRWVELFREFKIGNIQKARDIQFELMPLIKALQIEPNPTPIKTALNLIGRPAGPVRPPLLSMKKKNKERMKTILEDFGLYASIKGNAYKNSRK